MGRVEGALVLCAPDSVIYDAKRAKVIPYGTTWRRDTFACTSKKTGLRCTNGSKHGWFLSRETSYKF